MYAVIFQAEFKQPDETYFQLAEELRKKAFEKYNCQGFQSYSEGQKEIAISYWNSLDDIQNWKNDKSHLKAQDLGRCHWYKSYSVKISKVERNYTFNHNQK